MSDLLYAYQGEDGYLRITPNKEAVPDEGWMNYAVVFDKSAAQKLLDNREKINKVLGEG